MNIRNWPMDRIMQLPDCCFGRRFVVSCDVHSYAGAYGFDISEVAFPERVVIWQVVVNPHNVSSADSWCRIALGDQLPTTDVQVLAMEPLLFGYGMQGPEPRQIELDTTGTITRLDLRMPVSVSGKRLVLEARASPEKICWVRVTVVVSSMPTEVPDWLFSEKVRSLL